MFFREAKKTISLTKFHLKFMFILLKLESRIRRAGGEFSERSVAVQAAKPAIPISLVSGQWVQALASRVFSNPIAEVRRQLVRSTALFLGETRVFFAGMDGCFAG